MVLHMAQYQHLPIYKSVYELLQLVTRITAAFPKGYRYSLGDKLRIEVVELVVLIFKANSVRSGRAALVGQLLERMQVVELLLRLSKDMRLMAVKSFSEAVVLTDAIGRQAQGWVKASNLLAESK
jgi:protein involved in polysaccharide export with SLBB domain